MIVAWIFTSLAKCASDDKDAIEASQSSQSSRWDLSNRESVNCAEKNKEPDQRVGDQPTGKHIVLTLDLVDDNHPYTLTMETTMTEYLTALYYLVFWVLLPLGAISAIPVLGMYCLFMDIAEKNQEKTKRTEIDRLRFDKPLLT